MINQDVINDDLSRDSPMVHYQIEVDDVLKYDGKDELDVGPMLQAMYLFFSNQEVMLVLTYARSDGR